MSDVTRILDQMQQGEAGAAEELLPLIYEELRKLAALKLAREKPGQTLEATALVHEAYLRLVHGGTARAWSSRGHFFAAAAEAMRRILVDQARKKGSLKRGGMRQRKSLELAEIFTSGPDFDILALDEALGRLAEERPERAEVVKLRYFAGLSVDETAQVLGIAPSTVDRYWTYARAWLLRELSTDSRG
jgi:RNA polymerase sigma factor (TIGR02999 family)